MAECHIATPGTVATGGGEGVLSTTTFGGGGEGVLPTTTGGEGGEGVLPTTTGGEGGVAFGQYHSHPIWK